MKWIDAKAGILKTYQTFSATYSDVEPIFGIWRIQILKPFNKGPSFEELCLKKEIQKLREQIEE